MTKTYLAIAFLITCFLVGDAYAIPTDKNAPLAWTVPAVDFIVKLTFAGLLIGVVGGMFGFRIMEEIGKFLFGFSWLIIFGLICAVIFLGVIGAAIELPLVALACLILWILSNRNDSK